MNKFKEIRPLALGLCTRSNKLLVTEGHDTVNDRHFYRCLGGGIEFLEKGEQALKREFKEELGIDITVKDFLGISENIFTFEGKNAHELILFYNIEIADEDYKDEYYVTNDSGPDSRAVWIDVEDFKSKKLIIFPEEVLKYL